MPKPSTVRTKSETQLAVLTWIVGEMADELMKSDLLKRQDFGAALKRLRSDVSTRSDLDATAAKELLKTFLMLADPNYQEP